MQIIVYKCVGNSLFIDRIEEKRGEGFVVCFPEEVEGKCHLGKHILPIHLGKCRVNVPLSREMYPVWVEGAKGRLEGEGLLYSDGRLHRATPEKFSRIYYELASLKAQLASLEKQAKALSDAVFHTVIF